MYKFKNKKLENSVFIHPSLQANKEFQRLEFLGDKILAYYLSIILYFNYNLSESEMTIALSQIVCRTKIAELGQFLVPKIKHKGEINDKIICDCLEAWLGAIYTEDINECFGLIKKIWRLELDNLIIKKNPKNYLQELSQKHKHRIFYFYKTIKSNFFECKLVYLDYEVTSNGSSKKEASEIAASKMIEKLNSLDSALNNL